MTNVCSCSYIQAHALGYMLKLYIEMNLADLIGRIVRRSSEQRITEFLAADARPPMPVDDQAAGQELIGVHAAVGQKPAANVDARRCSRSEAAHETGEAAAPDPAEAEKKPVALPRAHYRNESGASFMAPLEQYHSALAGAV